MNFLPVSIALLISAAAALASVSLVTPSPRDGGVRTSEGSISPVECIGYAKLNILLGTARHAEEFLLQGRCNLESKPATGLGVSGQP